MDREPLGRPGCETWGQPNTPRWGSRTFWPDSVCEFVDDDMCGERAAARITSRATGDHLWCCSPHAEHMLRVSPEDAYVSWAKPGTPCPGSSGAAATP